MPQVLDYSAGFPGARAIRDAGYIGAVRYIGSPGNRKCTTRAELADFNAFGLGMALVFEQFATDWRGGYQAGAANMRRSLDHAYEVRWPADDRPIYMAVDQDVVTPGEFDAAMDYLLGAADAHKGKTSTGPYGEHDVCARSAAAGFVWQWQCRAWSGTPPRLFSGRRLYQEVGTVRVGGIDCDINQVLQSDWGQHTTGDDDMPYSPSEIEDMVTRGVTSVLRDISTGNNVDGYWAVNKILGDHAVGPIRGTLAGLADDEAKIIEAIRTQPTGGQVDIPAFVAALVPALVPALPQGVTVDQLKQTLVDTLNNVRLSAGG